MLAIALLEALKDGLEMRVPFMSGAICPVLPESGLPPTFGGSTGSPRMRLSALMSMRHPHG